MRLRGTFLLCAAFSLATHAWADEPLRQRKLLVVQTLVTDGTDAKVSRMAEDLTDELVLRAGSLSKQNGVEVKSESELQLLADQIKEMGNLRPQDCAKLEECLARIFGGEADQVLRGTLGRLGESWVVTLKLINLKTMAVERARSCLGETREELIEAMKAATADVLGYASAAPAEVPLEIVSDGRTIGVVPIRATEADERSAYILNELLSTSIRSFGFSAQTRDDVFSMIHYATDRANVTGESMTESYMEIAASSGVSLLVTGNIGRVEKTHLISLKLIDLDKDGEVVSRVLESAVIEEAHLGDVMKYACARLFGRPLSGDGGPVSILTDVEGSYTIDQGKSAMLPQVTATTGLAPGKHQLNITAPDYFPYYAEIYVFNDSLRYRPRLEPLPEPFYESPLFLSIAGVVVAGTATAIVLAVMPGGSGYSDGLK